MKQQRNTRQRQLVLEAVQDHCDHPTADQIYLDVRARDSRISRGTVYRNLGILEDNGEILHVKVPSADRFDYRTDLHYHLFCTKCGAVSDAPAEYDRELDERLSSATGFAVERHRTVFEGLCPKCREAGSQ